MTTPPEMQDVQIGIEGNDDAKYYPHFPEGMLPENAEVDPPKYEGDTDDITERLRFKTFQVWNTWSSLITNERLIKSLALNKKDTDEVQYLKAIIVMTMDRLGKILGNTDIVGEMKRGETEVSP